MHHLYASKSTWFVMDFLECMKMHESFLTVIRQTIFFSYEDICTETGVWHALQSFHVHYLRIFSDRERSCIPSVYSSDGLHCTKRSLMPWVVVIPKEGRARVAAPALLLV